MIQDIFPHRLDNHYRPGEVPDRDDILFCFDAEKVACRLEGDRVIFPHVSDYDISGGLIYLFDIDGHRFFLASGDNPEIMGTFDYIAVRNLRKKDVRQKHLIFAAITARHLNDWYRSARYCGRCGSRLVHSDKERAMVCPACKKIFYPRLNPAVIVAVTNGDSILLTRYRGRRLSSYALVAGFTEIGETLEETVAREVMEETGLHVTNIRYYKSQPWGYSGDILSGFFCDLEGDSAIHMDAVELKEALWVPRAEVTGQADDFSLTNEMMMAFRDGKEKVR